MVQLDAHVRCRERFAAGGRPLDERHGVRAEVVVPGEELGVGSAAQPVQVEVMQLFPVAAVVALRQRERRAGDGAPHAARTQHLTDERGLPRAEVALHGEQHRRMQPAGQHTSELPRLGRRGEGERDHVRRGRAAPVRPAGLREPAALPGRRRGAGGAASAGAASGAPRSSTGVASSASRARSVERRLGRVGGRRRGGRLRDGPGRGGRLGSRRRRNGRRWPHGGPLEDRRLLARRGRRVRQQLGQVREVRFERGPHGRRVERRGRMEDGVQVQGVPGDLRRPGPAVHLGDACGVARQELGGEVAERADDLGPDDLDLPEQVRAAGLDLLRLRVAVVGRAALEDVGDVDLLARHADGREQLLEQLAGLAYERPALLVLVVAGRLSHEHQVGAGVSLAEHGLGARGPERAPGAALDLLTEGVERGDDVVSGRCHSSHWRSWSSSWSLPCRRGWTTMSGRRTWRAGGRRRRSDTPDTPAWSPLRTSSSNAVPHWLQQNS